MSSVTFRDKYILVVTGCILDLCDRILLSFVRKFLGNLSMFSVQIYVNFLTTFYTLKNKFFYIFQIAKVYSKIGLICAIFIQSFDILEIKITGEDSDQSRNV